MLGSMVLGMHHASVGEVEHAHLTHALLEDGIGLLDVPGVRAVQRRLLRELDQVRAREDHPERRGERRRRTAHEERAQDAVPAVGQG